MITYVGVHEKPEFMRFLAMSADEFDSYMCSTYRNQFTERTLPMTETCMCWGFEIGPGWRYYLDEMCKKLAVIEARTGIGVVFQQVKEKYASGSFYYHTTFYNAKLDEAADTWHAIIEQIITDYEDGVGYISEASGKRINGPVTVNNWVHALTPEEAERLKKARLP